MGSIIGDLNRRRGIMKAQEPKGAGIIIKADVPLSEMFGYITDLRTLTSGRASSSMEFSHYAPAPNAVAEKVIEEAKAAV
jgi:elongation factor G